MSDTSDDMPELLADLSRLVSLAEALGDQSSRWRASDEWSNVTEEMDREGRPT
jgi:hypothetical protein